MKINGYLSYVAEGAPSNQMGHRSGFGLTERSAHEDADHWTPDLPWVRVTERELKDHESADVPDGDYFWLCRWQQQCEDMLEYGTEKECEKARRALAFFKKGKLASGWASMHSPELLEKEERDTPSQSGRTTMYEYGVSAGEFRARKPPFSFKLSEERIRDEASKSFVNAAWTRRTDAEDYAEYIQGFKDGYYNTLSEKES